VKRIERKNLNVVGLHCYAGGFLLGLAQAGARILASAESWNLGRKAALELELPAIELEKLRKKKITADILVSNPPCSRFSHLSFSFFKRRKGTYESLSSFPELLDILDISKQAKVKVVWWETGPLAWNRGFNLILKMHEQLKSFWGRISTLMIKLDLRYIGIPQRRPRIHILHIAKNAPPPNALRIKWPIRRNLYDWIRIRTKDMKLQLEVKPNKEISNPIEWAEQQHEKMTFRSMVPKIFSKKDTHCCSIVSRRLMLWEEENRFWDLLEHAAAMTYPLDNIANLLKIRKSPIEAQVLLAKSVAPAASRWICENILIPWRRENLQSNNPTAPISQRENFYKLDLSIPHYLDRNIREGQTIFPAL